MSILSYYKTNKYETPVTYAVKHKDNSIRMESRSGGIFTALSDCILDHGGVVYGCVLDDSFSAIHLRAENKTDRDRMRGSKYVQSELRDIYTSVKKDLECKREVLFSGTSCQVSGLKGYLGKEYINLFCVDIVCHGVPSPMIWKEYLKWQEKKYKRKIVGVDFRNKKDFGWMEHIETLYFDGEKQIDSKIFATLFYNHSFLRPCCYKCPYKDIIHPGDISIADYWGIENAVKGFSDNKGVSLVLINNEIGERLFNSVTDQIVFESTKIADSMQSPLIAPFNSPDNRDKIWDEVLTTSFDTIARKYGGDGVLAKLKILKRKLNNNG